MLLRNCTYSGRVGVMRFCFFQMGTVHSLYHFYPYTVGLPSTYLFLLANRLRVQPLMRAVGDGGEKSERDFPRRVQEQRRPLPPGEVSAPATLPRNLRSVRDAGAPCPRDTIARVGVGAVPELVSIAVLVMQKHVHVTPSVLPQKWVLVRRIRVSPKHWAVDH